VSDAVKGFREVSETIYTKKEIGQILFKSMLEGTRKK